MRRTRHTDVVQFFHLFLFQKSYPPTPFNCSEACQMRIAECGIRNVKTPETHFIQSNPTDLPQSTGREGQKTQKPTPPLRIGFNFNQSFGYPHPNCPTIPEKQQIDNQLDREAGGVSSLEGFLASIDPKNSIPDAVPEKRSLPFLLFGSF
jgi:hypothetical protein